MALDQTRDNFHVYVWYAKNRNMATKRISIARAVEKLETSDTQRRQNRQNPSNIDTFHNHIFIFLLLKTQKLCKHRQFSMGKNDRNRAQIKLRPRNESILVDSCLFWCRWVAKRVSFPTVPGSSKSDKYWCGHVLITILSEFHISYP